MDYKILIVDDSKLARMAVNRLLKTLYPSWTSLEAASGDDATKTIEEQAPDIALLDFNMPGRDGLELAAELHQSRPGMPIAVISANHQQAVIDRARAAGATFLPKPLNEAALRSFLQEAEQQLKANS